MFRAAGIHLKDLVRSTRSLPRVRLFTDTPFDYSATLKLQSDWEHFARRYNLKSCLEQEATLNALKTANVTRLSPTCENGVSGVTAVNLPGLPDCAKRTTLYIPESFCGSLDFLRKTLWSIVIGNKAWFRWYILYCFVNENVELGPNHLNSTDRPKVIAHQLGTSLFLYFPKAGKVFQTNTTKIESLLKSFEPSSVLYLVDPRGYPITWIPYDVLCQTIMLRCNNPNRFQEYLDRGATAHYMPYWDLNELKLVGAEVASCCESDERMKDFYSPEEITKRYKQCGGVLSAVIPLNDSAVTALGRQLQKVYPQLTRTRTYPSTLKCLCQSSAVCNNM